MPESQRRAGTIEFSINGVTYDAKGKFSYNLGLPLRKSIEGADGIHGFSEKPQVAYIEGEITDRGSLNLKQLLTAEGSTVLLRLANGKKIMMEKGYQVAPGKVETDEANIEIRFEGASAEEF